MKTSSISLALVASSIANYSGFCVGLLNNNAILISPLGNLLSQAPIMPHSSPLGQQKQRAQSLSFSLQSKREEDGEHDRDEKDQACSDGRLPPPQNRRTRNTRYDVPVAVGNDEKGLVQLLESSINLLTTPLLVFGYHLPIIYPAIGLFAINFVPQATWVLSTVFFGVYLWLGTAIAIDPDKKQNTFISYDYNGIEEDDDDEDDDVGAVIFPLVAFTGAIASGALLSPQGLVMESTYWFSEFTSAVSLAAISVAFGWALISDVRDIRDAEEQLEVKERQEQVVRDDLRRMDQWDEDFEDKFS